MFSLITRRIFYVICPLILFAFSPYTAFAAPVLNFSDIISGPSSGLGDGLGQGAIVTIWGNNLGSSQGTSTIRIGGVAPAYIYYWKNADGSLPGGPADLYTYQQMQEIAFSIPSSLANGNYEITVTVNGETSNPLPFTVRSGHIYHAMTTGSASGDGSFNHPWKSLAQGGIAGMSAGDILYLHNGVSDTNTHGTTGVLVSGKTGSLATQYAIVAYPGARYTLTGSSTALDFYNSNSFVVSKFHVEGGYFDEPSPSSTTILDKNAEAGKGLEGSQNGRLVGNEVTEIAGKCSSGYGGAIVASSEGGTYNYTGNLKIFGNYVHDWGCNQTSTFEHTTYISIRNNGAFDVAPWEIGWNFLKDNWAKYGIHNYDETYANACGNPTGTVKIHDNYVVNQKGAGINVGSRANVGENCWTKGEFDIYNNVVIQAGKGPSDENGYDTNGIRVGDAGMTSPVKIFNNTIYGFGDDSLGAGGGIAAYNTNNSGRDPITITNNIVYDTRGGKYTDIPSSYTKISGSNNLWYSSGGASNSTVDSRLTNNIFKDPQFVNPSSNYQLKANSPAINAGVTGLSNADILQTPRPVGAFDIGAYEYKYTLFPPTNLRIVPSN